MAQNTSSDVTGREPVAPDGVRQPELSFAGLTAGEIEVMREAALQIAECQRVLAKPGLNVVGELLRGHDTFYEDDHYPTGDVFDASTGSQYYYHAHRGIELEHGHFHTFLRGHGLLRKEGGGSSSAASEVPAEVPGDDILVHLVGVSMDPWGMPMALLTLFRAQVRALLAQRDAVVAEWAKQHPDGDAFEDRRLELTGWIAIDPRRQVAELDRLCSR